MTSRIRRVLLSATAVAGLVGTGLAVDTVGPTKAGAASLSVTETWSHELSGPTLASSPALAELPTGPAVVFGNLSGDVYALNLSNGATVPGWPQGTIGGAPVDGPVSVNRSTVYVPVGDYGDNTGGYQAINPAGGSWSRTITLQPGGAGPDVGVIAGLTVGDIHGTQGVYAGSLGQMASAFNAASGATLPGFPWFQGDTEGGTAALADLYGNGALELVQGGASTAGLAYGTQYYNGGHVRVLNTTGTQVCNYNTSQPVMASPAVGDFLANGAVGIVAATDSYYSDQGGVNQVLGFNNDCQEQWSTNLDGTPSDPALVDAQGNGGLQIAVNAVSSSKSGTTYLLDGANGSTIWSTPTLGAAAGSPVSVDLGGGYQDIIVTGTGGIQILDGQNGAVLWSEASSNQKIPFTQNAALVTEDANGSVGITVVGYDISPYDTLAVHFEVAGSNGSLVGQSGGWPEFHHDAQLTGDASTPQPDTDVACQAPSSPDGYMMAASDGEVFDFGNIAYCGDTYQLASSSPIAAVAATPDGGGYYLVLSTGGVFAFGDARFYGAASSSGVSAPITAFAVTPDGRGYYEVTSHGGVYSYGDAKFHGAATPYNPAPITGIAVTDNNDGSSGFGYWLVTSFGGVYSFNAHSYGAATGAPSKVVGIAAGPGGNGYWLAATGGGIYSYGVNYHGAASEYGPNSPIVGLVPGPGEAGYWEVTAEGGVFSFGSAANAFKGSTGQAVLAAPIVGMSASE